MKNIRKKLKVIVLLSLLFIISLSISVFGKIIFQENGFVYNNLNIPHLNKEIIFCPMGGICTLESLTVYDLFVIGNVFNVTMTNIFFNVTFLNVDGSITADFFIGDGSKLTNINVTLDQAYDSETGIDRVIQVDDEDMIINVSGGTIGAGNRDFTISLDDRNDFFNVVSKGSTLFKVTDAEASSGDWCPVDLGDYSIGNCLMGKSFKVLGLKDNGFLTDVSGNTVTVADILDKSDSQSIVKGEINITNSTYALRYCLTDNDGGIISCFNDTNITTWNSGSTIWTDEGNILRPTDNETINAPNNITLGDSINDQDSDSRLFIQDGTWFFGFT